MQLYAELLLNVKTLNVWLTIPPSELGATSPVVQYRFCSEPETRLIISHNGLDYVLILPCKVAVNLRLYQELVVPPSGSLTLRFDLSRSPELQTLTGDAWRSPWQAGDLQDAESICCRECQTALIHTGGVTSWRDLPSENWAEMMDFWHCHKPDQLDSVPDGHSKGYSASSRLVARQSTGLVNDVMVLVSSTDIITDTIKTIKSDNMGPELICSRCGQELGYIDAEKHGWGLYKWNLAVAYAGQLQLFSLEKWISLFLASKLEAFTLRRATILSDNLDVGRATEIWIVVPELWVSGFSAPGDHTGTLMPAVKMLYKTVSDDADESSKTGSFGEELSLPKTLYDQMLMILQRNEQSISPGSAMMKDWNVSYLQRFGP